MMRSREEHLAWCKERALEYLDAGNVISAGTSMLSDLSKHPDFERVACGAIGGLGLLYMQQGDAEGMRRWIEGFR